MPIRSFGSSATKAELTKRQWFPVMAANGALGLDVIGAYASRLIDAAGEEAYVTGYIAPNQTNIDYVALKVIGNALSAAMHIDIQVDNAMNAQVYNFHTVTAERSIATVANTIHNIDITALFGTMGDLDNFGVRAAYRAADAHAATNMHVLGVAMAWR